MDRIGELAYGSERQVDLEEAVRIIDPLSRVRFEKDPEVRMAAYDWLWTLETDNKRLRTIIRRARNDPDSAIRGEYPPGSFGSLLLAKGGFPNNLIW